MPRLGHAAAVRVLELGKDVVLDWNQWNAERRAEGAGCRVLLHYLDVSLDTAIQQTKKRTAPGSHQIDEADVRHFSTIFQPPTPDEGIAVVTVMR